MKSAQSWGSTFSTCNQGEDVVLIVNGTDGPRITDATYVFTREQARIFAENLLESIQESEPEQEYPIPPADLAQHMYGIPYGEEFE